MTRALVAVAIAAAALWGIDAAQMHWDFLPPATCMPDHCFCEAVRPFGVRQLANTWSNLGFVFVGALIWRRDRLFGAVIAFLGVASAAYHASMSFLGQWIDNVSMYLFLTLALVRSVIPYVAVNLALAATVLLWPDSRRWAFAALVLLVAAREISLLGRLRALARRLATPGEARRVPPRRPSLRWLGASTAALAASFLVWNLDQRHVICWGHAAWHLGNAVAAGFLFLHIARSGGGTRLGPPEPVSPADSPTTAQV